MYAASNHIFIVNCISQDDTNHQYIRTYTLHFTMKNKRNKYNKPIHRVYIILLYLCYIETV